MLSPLEVSMLVVTAITALSGTTINTLVLTLYLLQWKRSRNSVVYEQIQISIALMNIFYQSFLIVDDILESLEMPFTLGKNVLLLIYILDFSFFYVSAWNTAWLSIYFYVRLVTFSHPYLLRMKAMFLSCVPQLLVASFLGLIIINVPSFWLTEVNPMDNRTFLTTIADYKVTIHINHTIFSSFFGCLLPLLLTCLCIGRCVTSLLRHVWRISFGESHLTPSQLQGHIRATRILIMRLALDLVFYLYSIVVLWSPFQIDNMLHCFEWIITLIYPTAQSLMLIYGNPQLRRQICRRCASN